jgi:hypothetical protein
MRNTLFLLLVCSACGDDRVTDGDLVTANIDGAPFMATQVGVTAGTSHITLQTTAGRRTMSVTVPLAVGSYSCATAQSGVLTIGLDYADLDRDLRANAAFAVAGSSCTIDVTASDDRFTGTFAGTVVSNDAARTQVVLSSGAFDVAAP